MENGIAGHLVSDHDVSVTGEARQRTFDCDIPSAHFDDFMTDSSCGIQHTAADAVRGRKPSGKHNAYSG